MKGKLRSSNGAGIGRVGMPSRRKPTRACSGPKYGQITLTPLTGPASSATSRAKQPLLAGHTKLFFRLLARDHEENPVALIGDPGVNVKREYPLFTQAIKIPGGTSRKYQRNI